MKKYLFAILASLALTACGGGGGSSTEVASDVSIKGTKPVKKQDTTAPVITLLGTNPLNLAAGTAYTEAGATCVDNKDRTCTVVTTGTVNTAIAGSYTITYTATDAAGNASRTTRAVTVAACTAAPIDITGYSLVFKGCDAANVAEYYAKDECVRDNATGLIWQGQTPTGTGLRARDQYKTNFDSITALQKYDTSVAGNYRAPTQAEVDAPTNSIGFKNAINVTNLCGSNAWRLPTIDELLGIVKMNPTSPMIDTEWFPNYNGADWYWSTTPSTQWEYTGLAVAFFWGGTLDGDRNIQRIYPASNPLVRLVR